ncbi:hypothetical protein [Paraburkholderia sp. J8-2]|uniref:hypothetical protein n=1 Tax=Paraburkholderia sp. J8-2 TaxID=2805440 RepID=UPI002AB6457E|nr:hypothetical protein [Paraburkholderia sp. J8-2]
MPDALENIENENTEKPLSTRAVRTEMVNGMVNLIEIARSASRYWLACQRVPERASRRGRGGHDDRFACKYPRTNRN